MSPVIGEATAIYVYFILSNGADPPYVADLTFSLDGQVVENYVQSVPPSNEPLPGYYYNSSVLDYSPITTPPSAAAGGLHNLTVSSVKGAMFDYAVYM